MDKIKKCRVYLVGAGPGCSKLISIKGVEILRQADCVLYDKLIGKDLLDYVSADAEVIYVGKDKAKQESINELLIRAANNHKIIVRLKGGDPMIFGRATEEIRTLIENGIDFEIIPGITAITAAAACSAVTLTDRNTASSLSIVTGQNAQGQTTRIDYAGLVRVKGTIVFYMTVGNMRQICQKLMKGGLDAETPAIVVANASLPNQRIIIGSISNIADKCKQANLQPPAVMIIGKKCVSLLQGKPLFGKKIVMTRDAEGNAEFACKLAPRGAEAIDMHCFEIQEWTDKKEFRQAVEKIKNFDWVFFTSPNGVRIFFKGIKKLRKDVRVFGDTKIGCIGSETARAIEEYGINADFVPVHYTSADLMNEFVKKYRPRGKKILLLRSALAEKMEIKGAKTENVSMYTAVKTSGGISNLDEEIDWITFASSFAVKCFFEKFDLRLIENVKIASIGPVTTESLRKLGIEPTVEAKEHTIDGLVEAMEKYGNHE
ncbi:MAG: uroporphyrinogen-III C-methyltransferase [Planctomycetes bacterium GWF2_42_9]|nr:MAG: uroporphyrinogen-III C-methyltransferase [Planctomycetes bacterium GWF2_42_9]HAL44565.1 uroporphyrinogen-III C-methyltransferase [Phycisphaerales bacterium]